ncbi:MAG: helix-turn-helix domain-containing protein, partial [Thermoplasmata archaeon]|nr:helix-turn-helix domain-containing protein [Thermoplasmata archaeon]
MAGAGLSHDAHILLTEGFVLPVGVLFARGIASGGKRVEIPVSDGERIYSAVSRGFSSVKVPRIYRVRTSSGRELAFSGGKLIVKKGSKISLVEPDRLRPGMHVYVASRIDLPVREGPLVTEWPPWTVLAGGELLTEFRRRLDFLRRRNGLRPVADQLGMSVSALYNYLSGRRNPPMSVVQRILESSQFRDARSFVVKGGLRERPVELPNRMNPILAEFLGIFSVQGAISEGGVSIVIPTVKIERRISILLLGAFGP